MTRNVTRRVQRSGFTLLETLMTLFLLMVILAGAYRVMVGAADLSRSARHHYLAINLAKNRLERARNFAYGDLSLLAENNVVIDDNGTPDTAGTFRRSTVVTTNYAPNLTKITVSVGMKNRRTGAWVVGGATESETVASLFTAY